MALGFRFRLGLNKQGQNKYADVALHGFENSTAALALRMYDP